MTAKDKTYAEGSLVGSSRKIRVRDSNYIDEENGALGARRKGKFTITGDLEIAGAREEAQIEPGEGRAAEQRV